MPIQFGGVRHLYGTSGADIMSGHTIYDDIFHGSAGADQMYGYGGHDTVDYSGPSQSGVYVDLGLGYGKKGDAEGDEYFNIENAIGSEGNDELIGSAANNRLDGDDGHDYLLGKGGADELYGGRGNDYLAADITDLVVSGGADTDTLEVRGEANITIQLNDNGSGTATSSTGTLSFTGIENVTGWLGVDHITGNSQANVINGKERNDELDGGRGNDTLTGGDDADTFVFDASEDDDDRDIITDFEVGLDKIDLSQTERFEDEDFDELLDDADQVGADVVIDMGDGTLTLQGIDIEELSASDFIF